MINTNKLYINLGFKLIDANINPNKLHIESYRDPKDFATVVRGYYTEDDGSNIMFERSINDDENTTNLEDVLSKLFYFAIQRKINPDYLTWLQEFSDNIVAKLKDTK